MLIGWMIGSVDPSLRSSLTYFESAKELWDDIRQRFSVSNGPRVHQLKSELARSVQNGVSIAVFYAVLKKYWDELDNYYPVRGCAQCANCTCNRLERILKKERDEEKIHQLLMGLNDAFATVRSSILAADLLPAMTKVYSTLVQKECQANNSKNREAKGDGAAFAVAGQRPETRGRDPPLNKDRDQVVVVMIPVVVCVIIVVNRDMKSELALS